MSAIITAPLRKRIRVAVGEEPADLVIQNCRVVNVYTQEILEGDIAVCDGVIAGIGRYEGRTVYDAKGQFALPGLIESHIHIESSMVSPEEFARMVVPHGTTTVIADPHEIVNVCGTAGLDYMMEASARTPLDVKYMLPSCVPCTPWEHAGAVLDAEAMKEPLKDPRVWGLGEFMNAPGVLSTAEGDLAKLALAAKSGKVIDGHAPGVLGRELMGYCAAGIRTDHECSTLDEMEQRLRCGMYVLLRYGSAAKNLPELVKGVNQQNLRRCLLCSDDRQSETLLGSGHLDDSLRVCVRSGLDPVQAVQMATLNAAECYGLSDRGGIAPGLRADIVLAEDLEAFRVSAVWIKGELAAENGVYLPAVTPYPTGGVRGSVRLKDFSEEKLKLRLPADRPAVAMQLFPGSLLTRKVLLDVKRGADGDFVFDPAKDVAKLAVVERHTLTGNVSAALLAGYGIRAGAVAITVAHDSHNIIVAGTNNADMAFAVRTVTAMNGGVVVVKDGTVLEQMPLPIAGLMSDQSGEWVEEKLKRLHRAAIDELGVSDQIDPIMTLCFMSLPVIPELKLTDIGLFDVTAHRFVAPDGSYLEEPAED